MASINKLSNVASIEYNGNTVNSLAAETILTLDPTIAKVVDKSSASIGEFLTYTITINNESLNIMNDIEFSDAIPDGSTYVVDSFEVEGVSVTPVVNDNTISYTIPTISAEDSATITFQTTIIGGQI